MHSDFAEGTIPPLAMMGAALYRYLPGCNAMLVNEAYVKFYLKSIAEYPKELSFF